MKKYIFLIAFLFLVFKNSYALSGIGGSGMVIDRESFGVEPKGAIAEGPGGYGSFGAHESFGAAGAGEIMSDNSRIFVDGGFGWMRTRGLPTRFEGNFGSRF